MLMKSIHIVSRQLFYLIAMTLILGLLGLIAAMWLSGEVAKRKDEIAGWMTQQVGYPVTIDSAGLYWYGLIPKLQIERIALSEEPGSKPVVTAGQVYLSLDLLNTLKTTEPVIAEARIEHAKLAVLRDKQGQIQLQGLASQNHRVGETQLKDVMGWMTWLKRVNVRDLDVQYQDHNKKSLSGLYQLHEAQVRFANNQWSAALELELPEQIGSEVTATGQAEVDADLNIENWDLRLQTEDVVLSKVIHDLNYKTLSIPEGQASVVADLNGNDETITADLSVALNEIVLHSPKTVEADVNDVLINRLQGRFHYQQQANAWQISADNIQLVVASEAWPVTHFSAEKKVDGEITATTNYLRLSDLTSIALMLEETPAAWRGIKPTGDLTDLSLQYQPETGVEQLAFKLEGMSTLPWTSYPGVNGLSLALDWDGHTADVTFNSHEVTLYADAWLADSVFLDALTGQVSWSKNSASDWVFEAQNLTLANADLKLKLDGSVDYKPNDVVTDLTLQLADVTVNRWQAYVPQKILPKDFKEWADDAFVDGTITNGTIRMQGDPSQFPFDDEQAQGEFDMRLNVENAHLHYAKGWPDLTQVNGVVSGQGNNLLIESQSGEIAGFAFKEVKTTIDNLVKSNPMLTVDGLLSGRSGQGLAFLQNSPLKPRFGSIAEWLKVEGSSEIKLGLTIPLVDPEAADVNGHITFANSHLTTKAAPGLNITNVNGLLNFSNDGVNAKQIKATAFGEPVTVDVATENDSTRIMAQGHAAIASLREVWTGIIPNFVSGRSAYQTTITIAEPAIGEFDVAVAVNSQLKGVSVDAPAPLDKTAESNTPFSLIIDESGITDETRYRIQAGDWLNVALGMKAETLRGEVVVGGGRAELTGQQLAIKGRLAELDVPTWLDWRARQPSTRTDSTADIGQVDVFIEKLRLPAEMEMSELALKASKQDNLWLLSLVSPDIRGKINVPTDLKSATPISAQLDYLKLNLPDSEENPKKPLEVSELWPSLYLDITQLEINDMNFGYLNLKGTRRANQWVLDTGSLTTPYLKANMTGNWVKTEAMNKSQFEMTVDTHDLNGALGAYGYQQVIEANKAQLKAALSWPGDSLNIAMDNVVGTLDLSVGRGRLISVEPGAAGRIFGLLSIAALPRRLSLDFKDLFTGGLNFSEISGKFNVAGGVARTSDLTLSGDSARIQMTGSIDTVEKTYDQVVKVTPKVSSTLPIAGAVAGGPIGLGVGTAILLVDKLAGTLFDKDIVNVITYSYELKGPWDNPTVHAAQPEKSEKP